MAKTFRVKILTLSKTLIDKQVEKVFLETEFGKIEFLANYAPSIISTKACVTKIINENGEEEKLFTSEGIVNIKNNELMFCCNSAEFPEDIDIERAKRAKERAEKRLVQKDKFDVARAQRALARANVRLNLK